MRVGIFCLFIFIQSTTSKQSGFPQCANKVTPDPAQTVAFKGWPQRLLCNILALSYNEESDNYDWEVYNLTKDDPIQCIITNATSVLDNITTSISELELDHGNIGYLIGEINDNTTLSYSLILTTQNGLRCLGADIVLNVTSQNESNCSEKWRKAGKPSSTHVGIPNKRISCDWSRHQSVFQVNRTNLITIRLGDSDCPLKTSQNKLKIGSPSNEADWHWCTPHMAINDYPTLVTDQMTFEWQHNCRPQLPEGVHLSENNTKLFFKPFDFKHAGFYSCSALYKGRKRFVASYYICAQHESEYTSHFVKCERSVVSLNPGKSDEVTCTATFGRGNLNPFYISAKLSKKCGNKTASEANCYTEKRSRPENRDVRCILKNFTDQCYTAPPPRELRSPPIASVQILIQFRNITRLDYGKYVIEVSGHWNSISPANTTVLLEPNLKPYLFTQIEIAGIAIGIVMVFIVIVLVLLYFSVYIRVYYKRHFGVFVIDNKKYGAVLAYNFSQDLDKFAQEDIRSSVSKIREVLERKGFRTYEEGRKGFAAGSRIETIEASIERSHRVLIFLSLEFIKDGWSMLALQKGFNEMIHSRSKLIFILLPGIKEYLKQHSKDDDSCRLIQRAVKLNYAIELPKDFSNRRFQYQLEDAMPKLPHRSPSQTSSLSSNYDITVPSYDRVNFRRCFSNETDITDVESPGLAPSPSALEMMSQLDEEHFDTAL